VDVSPEMWQMLEVRWRTILGVEASIETLRLSMESLRSEMENAFKKQLNVEEKVHALQADVAQWNKAKSRIHYALPKVREFIHRATWAPGIPERKRMEIIVKDHIEPQIPFPELDQVSDQLDFLQKDRQVLSTTGHSLYQECRGIIAEIQRTLSALQRNAVARARSQRDAKREKGKYY
jgi:chromosome segregation ATPase